MKSIKRLVRESFHRGKTVRVVVMGAKGSGKTSLITSLYSNLLLAKGKSKEEGWLDLGDWVVDRFELCETELPRGVHPFDLKDAQAELKKGYYPNATTDWSVLKILVRLKNVKSDKRKIVNLEILDLPGERVADFTMVDKKKKSRAKFEAWSKSIYDFYGRPEEYDRYEDTISKIKLDDQEQAVKEILSAYKTFLSDMSKEKRSRFFTPSTVRLNEKGVLLFTPGIHEFDDWARETKRIFYPDNKDFGEFVKAIKEIESNSSIAEDANRQIEDEVPNADDKERNDSWVMIKECFKKHEDTIPCIPTPIPTIVNNRESITNNKLVVNVDCRKMMELCKLGLEGYEFAPLPKSILEKPEWKNIIQRFRIAYKKYYEKIVRPIVTWCNDVDQLYYLVDILTILKDGRDALDIQKSFGEKVLEFFSDRISPLPLVGRLVDAMPKWRRSSLQKGCIVATQVDRVVIAKSKNGSEDRELNELSDKNKKNIENLAKELFGHLIDAKSVETIACAAIVSYTAAKVVKDNDRGFCVKSICGESHSSRSEPVPPVPSSWPQLDEDWEPNKTFVFSRTDMRRKCDPFSPPPLGNFQLNLVARAMLGI